jgi:hypothetical protein
MEEVSFGSVQAQPELLSFVLVLFITECASATD